MMIESHFSGYSGP